MAKRDYYEVLGVDKNASEAEIKKAYHKLALKWHPDRHVGKEKEKKVAEEKFKEIGEAYSVLSDKEKRQNYDHYGHAGTKGFQAGGGFEGFDKNASSIFKDIFDSFFGGESYSRRAPTATSEWEPKKGEDILIKFTLNFKEAVLGVTHQIVLELDKVCAYCKQTGAYSDKHISKCSTCKGKGIVQIIQKTFFEDIYTRTTCPNCQGRGRTITKKCPSCLGKKFTKKKETISIDIPRGVQGNQLRMKNAGNDGLYGAEKGDIYIEIAVKKHRYFQRKGNDIHVELPISFLDAALGNYVEVITLEGLEKIRVPAGTQSNDYYTLKDKGCFLGISNSSRGDFYIHFQVVIPRKLTEETKETLKKIEQRSDWNPNREFIKRNEDILKE
ncbi:molecular chaperone DnaJ [endosymbiont GvMRE of Glomus versiforme]|uniref:molecular chaperone DnaJ n=1 Tax=endosymbiont GvMRE of Glomus versiforme TaxID=2039283 RepID=UPI000ED23E1B|nr:molecular chaperone DnaJ [endosymbiont GvMRE of Glomus versiforme]RHZ36672.1 Chaperone protein DnaJ [endosymbiont GvMRE of Glomus versiforme]